MRNEERELRLDLKWTTLGWASVDVENSGKAAIKNQIPKGGGCKHQILPPAGVPQKQEKLHPNVPV
jgi:hypothetical protein